MIQKGRWVPIDALIEIDGLLLANDLHRSEVSEIKFLRVAQILATPSCDQDGGAKVLGQAFDSGSGINSVGNDGRIQPLNVTGDSHDEVAILHSNSYSHRGPAFVNPLTVVFLQGHVHLYRSPKGMLGSSRKQGHEAITQVLHDETLVFTDDRPHLFVERVDGIGVISKEEAIDLGFSGPNLRASGVEHDIRRAQSYLQYDQIDFKIPVYTEGDCLARYFVRVDEMRESAKIVHQVLERMPEGETILNKPKKVLPHKTEVYTKMEELIHDFMIVNFGINPPEGEIYHAIEGSKGELGFYLVSKGEGRPWKCKIRSPSFNNIQVLPKLVVGQMISDVVAIIGSIDPIMGEADK